MDNVNAQESRNRGTQRIKLCSINICGMSDRSRTLLDKYSDKEELDLLFVQETGSSCKNKLNLTNMNIVTDQNNAKNRGAALYARGNVSLTNLSNLALISSKIDSAWSLAVINNTRYILGSVYVKLNYDQAIVEVLKMLNEAEKMTKKLKAAGVVLGGDFNARHAAWKDTTNNQYGNQLFEKLDNTKFTVCTSNTPTFLTEKGSSVIDMFIVSNRISNRLDKCYTDKVVELFSGAPIRGHLPLLSNLVTSSRRSNTPAELVEEKLDIDSVNWQLWSKDIEDEIERREALIQTENPQLLWQHALEIINAATTTHGKLKRPGQHSKPYWTKELTVLLNKMKTTRKAYNKRNTDPNKEAMFEAKEQFDSERKKACENFILEKTKSLNTAESVAFWKKFNQLFKSRTNKGVDPLIDDRGGIATENCEIEQKLFSTFFESKHLISTNFDDTFYEEVNRLYEEIVATNYEPQTRVGNTSNLQSALNSEITIEEIKAAIKKTKCSNKSLDNHKMHPRMLHNFGPNALKLLQKLFNSCMNRGKWIWNEAEVIFLKKDGKDSYAVPGAYRPISITSYIGKILEKILASRITIFLERQGILDPDQEGFTKQRNTHRYLNRLILEIKNDLRENTVIALFVDLEKAFDSVWKKGLIVKLSKLNISGKSLGLIDDFLNTRKVQLNINGEMGETRECNEYGLPQGSALAPVLFKIFLLDFFGTLNSREDISVFKFADDGSIKIKNKSSALCAETLQEVVDLLNSWTRKWRININCQPNKTEYICFGVADNKVEDIPVSVKLGNKEVMKVCETKVLGLTVDENLSFVSHSQNVYNKIQGKWASICNYTNKHWGFNQKVLTQIAQTFFLTSLHYAGIIWINERNTKEIEKLWYKIIKSTVGATFNVRKTVAEVILGIPPILIQNKMHKVKYYLKLNIKPAEEDRVREFIKDCYDNLQSNEIVPELRTSIKDVYKFLRWKLDTVPDDFTAEELNIIEQRRYSDYFNLSTKACSYTKTQIFKYTELLWQSKISNEYSMEGYHHAPKPTCSRLPIPINTARKDEVLLMSLFYPNNLLNSHLYRNTNLVESPLCGRCGRLEETPYHIIMECSDLAEEAKGLLEAELREGETLQEDSITLLNGSRNKDFIRVCLNILAQYEHRHQVDLTTNNDSN